MVGENRSEARSGFLVGGDEPHGMVVNQLSADIRLQCVCLKMGGTAK